MDWLAMQLPQLALELFTQQTTQDSDGETPLVILQDNRVAQLNPTAQRLGIVPGTTLATAHSICPTIQHAHRDIDQELDRLGDIAELMYRFSGLVAIQPEDCVLVEIGGSIKLFGCTQVLIEQITQLCGQHGHHIRTATANTPWAAIALARSGRQSLESVPLAAAGLHLAGIEPRLLERLSNMGIHTLAPLLKLPRKALGKRFGKPLLRYIEQLSGHIADPRKPIKPAADFTHQQHLLKPITQKDALFAGAHSPLNRLSLQLQDWLVAHQLGCDALEWHFASHNRQRSVVPVHFGKARQDQAGILAMTRLAIERHNLPEEVLTVGLHSTSLSRWLGGSEHLFRLQPGMSEDSEDHAGNELIDALSARFGSQVCSVLHLNDQHAPEQAGSEVGHKQRPHAEDDHFIAALNKRPLWLFDPPRPIARQHLELLHGPERIQSAWWQAQMISRDYYVARYRNGAECWVFLTQTDAVEAHYSQASQTTQHRRSHTAGTSTPHLNATQKWYLHGYFG